MIEFTPFSSGFRIIIRAKNAIFLVLLPDFVDGGIELCSKGLEHTACHDIAEFVKHSHAFRKEVEVV